MYTLLIDTHMANVILVLFKNGKIQKQINEVSFQSHSVITMPLLKELLENAKISVRDLNDIIVINGPGSFTGVRIGVTIAKTISYCLNTSIRAISSLEALVASLPQKGAKNVAINDKNGYFVAKFDDCNRLLEEYQYISNKDYITYKKENDVIDSFNNIDYEKVYLFAHTKEALNPHLVNPLYVKKIEVQK